MNLRIFISSVQKEFAEERRLLKRYISKKPMLSARVFGFGFGADLHHLGDD